MNEIVLAPLGPVTLNIVDVDVSVAAVAAAEANDVLSTRLEPIDDEFIDPILVVIWCAAPDPNQLGIF